jgi:hypothetical protein
MRLRRIARKPIETPPLFSLPFIETMLRDLCRAGVEGMTDMSGAGQYQMYKELVASILALVLSIAIVAFVGKFLWNTTVAELFTVVRPVRSAWQIIGLLLLMALLR